MLDTKRISFAVYTAKYSDNALSNEPGPRRLPFAMLQICCAEHHIEQHVDVLGYSQGIPSDD